MSKSRGPYMCPNGHLLGERVYFALTGCRRCRENERRRQRRERLRHEQKAAGCRVTHSIHHSPRIRFITRHAEAEDPASPLVY